MTHRRKFEECPDRLECPLHGYWFPRSDPPKYLKACPTCAWYGRMEGERTAAERYARIVEDDTRLSERVLHGLLHLLERKINE